MSFTVRFTTRARRQLASWHLPDPILMDAYLRPQNDLVNQPAQLLQRTTHPFDGLTYTLMLIDRSNRTFGYVLMFLVKYGADEETLWVTRGIYERIAI